MTTPIAKPVIPFYLERDLTTAREELRSSTETAKLAEKLFFERADLAVLISEQTEAILANCGRQEALAELDTLRRALGQRNREEVIRASTRVKELEEECKADPKNPMLKQALESCKRIASYATSPEKNRLLFSEIEKNHASSCSNVREALMRSVVTASERVRDAQFRVDLAVRRCQECLANPRRFA